MKLNILLVCTLLGASTPGCGNSCEEATEKINACGSPQPEEWRTCSDEAECKAACFVEGFDCSDVTDGWVGSAAEERCVVYCSDE